MIDNIKALGFNNSAAAAIAAKIENGETTFAKVEFSAQMDLRYVAKKNAEFPEVVEEVVAPKIAKALTAEEVQLKDSDELRGLLVDLMRAYTSGTNIVAGFAMDKSQIVAEMRTIKAELKAREARA